MAAMVTVDVTGELLVWPGLPTQTLTLNPTVLDIRTDLAGLTEPNTFTGPTGLVGLNTRTGPAGLAVCLMFRRCVYVQAAMVTVDVTGEILVWPGENTPNPKHPHTHRSHGSKHPHGSHGSGGSASGGRSGFGWFTPALRYRLPRFIPVAVPEGPAEPAPDPPEGGGEGEEAGSENSKSAGDKIPVRFIPSNL
jgi:hypothetical protein